MHDYDCKHKKVVQKDFGTPNLSLDVTYSWMLVKYENKTVGDSFQLKRKFSFWFAFLAPYLFEKKF